ncbi:MAG: DUF72 domain-containing protein [Candidatus Altiarchaeota archaeon]
MRIYVGCCGFPIAMNEYFRRFNLVELQSTFYKLPSERTAEKWRSNAPKNFKFTLKAFQGISHPIESPTWRKFSKVKIESLKGRVGFLKPTPEVFEFFERTIKICKVLKAEICLIQLPASFTDTKENFENAEKFFSEIKKNKVKIALELRGWSQQNSKLICKKFNLIEVTDPFIRMPSYIKEIVYFRLHGSYEKRKINYNYKYSSGELKELLKKIESLTNVKEVYCLFNNLFMKENAIEFRKLI